MGINIKVVRPPDIYWNSFKLLYKDLEDSFRFVNPTTEHLGVYSLRFYELFIRACTEFESLCKEKTLAFNLSQTDPKNFRVNDYHLLNKHFENKPSKISIGFIFANPIFVKPLDEWESSHTLSWYKDYNLVKHNRAESFPLANLSNVLKSIAALFIIIERCNLCPRGELSFMQVQERNVKILSHDEWHVILRKEY